MIVIFNKLSHDDKKKLSCFSQILYAFAIRNDAEIKGFLKNWSNCYADIFITYKITYLSHSDKFYNCISVKVIPAKVNIKIN